MNEFEEFEGNYFEESEGNGRRPSEEESATHLEALNEGCMHIEDFEDFVPSWRSLPLWSGTAGCYAAVPDQRHGICGWMGTIHK